MNESQSVEIRPVRKPVQAELRPPGSKSLTNRALVCAALADGVSTLSGALSSEDTQVMIDALRCLGIAVVIEEAGTLVVTGCGGQLPARSSELYVANSGTTVRFLTALVALGKGDYRLHGTDRMHERPIQDLLDALRQLGAQVHCENDSGCPPVVVAANGLRGGHAQLRGDVSSQFLSGLLLAAPYAQHDVDLDIEGKLVSRPYVEMTTRVMSLFGAEVQSDPTGKHFHIPAGHNYVGHEFTVEPDASAASYFWAAAAITGGEVTIQGLSRSSIQGDVRFCDLLQRMGCQVTFSADSVTVIGGHLRGIHVQMEEISDTVQTLAAVALFAEGPTTIGGVGHIRYKESDRIGDLTRELRKLGAVVESREDGLTITPGKLRGATIETYNDHRMAMSLALVGLNIPGVVILNPACTDKTYPQFFADLRALRRES